MVELCGRFQSDEAGATMVEYGLLIALIALVAAMGASVFGASVNEMFFNEVARLAESLR